MVSNDGLIIENMDPCVSYSFSCVCSYCSNWCETCSKLIEYYFFQYSKFFYRLTQGFLLSSTQQILDRLAASTQDSIDALRKILICQYFCRLTQGFLLSSTQQILDRLAASTQDSIDALRKMNPELVSNSPEVSKAGELIREADNSKHLL